MGVGVVEEELTKNYINLVLALQIIIVIMICLFNSWQSATTQQAAMQDSTDTIEHKEPIIIQPNITYKI